MRRYLVLGLGIVLVAFVVVDVTAQTGLQLHISSFMTPQELQTTGVGQLSPAQRAALDKWLNRYTRAVIRTARGSEATDGGTGTASEYITGKGHWVQEVSGNGAILTLEDDSMWEIISIDQVDTALWLPTTDITVIRDPRPVGDYKYVLVNTEDGEKAHAKYMGRH